MCFGCFGFSVFVFFLNENISEKVNNLVGGLTKD